MKQNVPSVGLEGMDTSQQRFDALVEAYYRPLYRYAFWLCRGQQQTAEDLVQETFLRAWRALDSLQDSSAAKAWLTTILRRENARRFQKPQLELAEYDLEQLPDTGTQFAFDPEQDALHQLVGKLPDLYREPLSLQLLFGYTQQEIATILELPGNTVATRLRRARLQLREWLSQPELLSTSRGQL